MDVKETDMAVKKEKMFVVKKYIKAKNAADAIRKDKHTPVDDVWIDDDWTRGNRSELSYAIGFNIEKKEDD